MNPVSYKSMIEQFLNHINKHSLFASGDKLLLAVSGGIDSMAMLHLVKTAGFHFGVAHCNFKLRAHESDKDEALVRQSCGEYGVPLFTTTFNTTEYAGSHGISLEMAARELRYSWFETICVQHGYDFIATAHHLNDTFETMLLNLVKGTGLSGLTGIPVKHGRVMRPLLFATRKQIEAYATEHSLKWREDASNAADHYQRNIIRNKVVPLLLQINPGLEKSFVNTLERIKGSHEFVTIFLKKFIDKAVSFREDMMLIKKDPLDKIRYADVLLWELLKGHGFNYDQCKEILTIPHQAGKIFKTATHQLTIDREELIVNKLMDVQQTIDCFINADCTVVECAGIKLKLQVVEADQFSIVRENSIAQLDADKVTFPLRWRSWNEGDRFIPLGMKHHKKISDLLVDDRVPVPEKEMVSVIESAGEIVWVVGRRIADPYKITEATGKVLIMKVGVAAR